MKRTAACLSAFAAAIFFSFPVLAGPASETGTAADGSGQKTQQVQDNPNFAPVKDQEGTVTLIAAGDDLIHANIYRRAFRPDTGTYDFHSLYEPVKDVISSYDLAVINQETILVDNPAMYSSYPAFGTPQEIGEALADTGFDIILSATNHTWDKGEYGVRNTLNYWKTNYPDITLLGIHDSPEDWNTIDIVEKNGIRMAMFNYTYGLNGMHLPGHAYYMVDLLGNRAKFLGDVRAAENLADITICFLHIGEEYHMHPTAFQMSYVQTLVDCGADVVICAHPHVIEPFQEVVTPSGNHGVVFWSCGNFISEQVRTESMLGGLACVTIQKTEENGAPVTRVSDYRFLPVVSHMSMFNAVYMLSDYTEELAAFHYLRYLGQDFTIPRLWAIWQSVTGEVH